LITSQRCPRRSRMAVASTSAPSTWAAADPGFDEELDLCPDGVDDNLRTLRLEQHPACEGQRLSRLPRVEVLLMSNVANGHRSPAEV
jgi:hypothetical protein